MYRNYKIFNASVYFAKIDVIFKYQLSILLVDLNVQWYHTQHLQYTEDSYSCFVLIFLLNVMFAINGS